MDLKDEETYARWLLWGTRLAVAFLAASFVAYLVGVLRPHVDPATLPTLWQLPVKRFLETTSEPAGWRWLQFWREGDYLTLTAITALALVTPLCYLQLAMSLVARRRIFFAVMAALQFAVFAAAALLGVFLLAGPA